MTWALLLILLTLLVLFSGQPLALSALGLLLTVSIASAAVTVITRNAWQLRLSAPVILEKNSVGTLKITAVNPSRLPVGQLYCILRLHNDLTGEQRDVPLLLPANREREVALSGEYCGRLSLTVIRASALGLLGVWGVKVPVSAQHRITILPDTFEPELRLTVPEIADSDSEAYAPDRSGHDMAETYRLRDYVPGDSLRQIHWKLSSKADHLVSREASQPILRSLLVYWDKTTAGASAMDTQAEVFASLCQSLCHQGFRFTMGWNEQERSVYLPIDCEDELLQAIPMALRSGAGRQTERQAFGKTILLTTVPAADADENTTVLLCGENDPGAVCYTPETYLTILQRLEL